jgi:hypothetical protein
VQVGRYDFNRVEGDAVDDDASPQRG